MRGADGADEADGPFAAVWLALEAVDQGVEAVRVVRHQVEEPERRAVRIDAHDEGQDVDRRAAVGRRELELRGLTRTKAAAHAHFHTGRRELDARAVQGAVRGGDVHAELHRGARGWPALGRALAPL